jgi:hypothetical protein
MQHVDEKNHHHYIPDNMVKMVSSRRGSNFLLHNLGENDVVFGTKGNGRNEVFLKVLERNSEQYIHLSKFQKMGLIQQIIREWKGNFYILNSKTNDLCLAKKNDHELSTTDPSARKLYTSVRRMMNYVNSKNQRQHQQQPQQQQQREISTTTVPTTPVPSRTTPTNIIPQVRKERIKKENNKNKNKKRKTVSATVSATSTNQGPTQTKHGIMMINTTAYINHDHHSILPRSDIGFPYSSASTTNDSMIIAAPQRSSTMVTPEPSPRTVFSFLPPPPPPTSSVSQVAISVTHPSISIPSSQDTTSVLTPSSSSLPPSSLSATTQEENRNHQHSAKETANNVVTAKYRNSNNSTADNIIGHMEESAILALAYLASTAF